MAITTSTRSDAVRAGDAPASAERVTFESRGETIVGRLYSAAFANGAAPAVAIIGPMIYQKEQAPAMYAPLVLRHILWRSSTTAPTGATHKGADKGARVAHQADIGSI